MTLAENLTTRRGTSCARLQPRCAEYERARLVSKLRHARGPQERDQRGGSVFEGRTPAHVLYPEATAEAKRLRRASPKTGKRKAFETSLWRSRRRV